MKMDANRRGFLKLGSGAAGAALMINPLSKALGGACGLTPPQAKGPFYPGETKFSKDFDLTFVPGNSQRALGQVVYVQGRVLDQNCKPVPNANVELWQACASGKYNNTKDPNPAAIDPNFRYWAEDFTNSQGEYGFKTIIPGAYPAAPGWTRPPHLHFRISCLGYQELITQMYFRGDALNNDDEILKQLSATERESVIVDFKAVPPDLEPGALVGHFEITIRTVK